MNQYFVDYKMLDNWGYEPLAKHYRDESIDEMKDADELIGRILFLEGVPNLQRLGTVRVGETVPEKLQLALDLEYESIERLNLGIAQLPRARRQRHPRAARAHPRGRGRARRLARDAARPRRPSSARRNYLAQQLRELAGDPWIRPGGPRPRRRWCRSASPLDAVERDRAGAGDRSNRRAPSTSAVSSSTPASTAVAREQVDRAFAQVGRRRCRGTGTPRGSSPRRGRRCTRRRGDRPSDRTASVAPAPDAASTPPPS